MSLKDRKSKKLEALAGSEVLRTDAKNRPILVKVPGSDSRCYTVTIGRKEGFHVSCKCGGQDCKGNTRHTVCYHSLAAIALAAGNRKIYWCENRSNADRLNRIIKGQVLPVNSLQGKGQAWLVVMS